MSVSPFDEELFQKACNEIIHKDRKKTELGRSRKKQSMQSSNVFMSLMPDTRKSVLENMLPIFSVEKKLLKYRHAILIPCGKSWIYSWNIILLPLSIQLYIPNGCSGLMKPLGKFPKNGNPHAPEAPMTPIMNYIKLSNTWHTQTCTFA